MKKINKKNLFQGILLIFLFILAFAYHATKPTEKTDSMVHNFMISGVEPSPTPDPNIAKIEMLEEVKGQLEAELVSRGDIERRELERKDRIIKTLNKNLGGLLKNKGFIFYEYGRLTKMNPLLVASIAMHETGNGTSQMLRECNNPGGLYVDGKWARYKSIDDGIYAMFEIVRKYYIDEGRTTIEGIGAKYCPIGASNDPTGINKYWVPSVTKNFTKLLNESGGIL